jgi:hypothetical protein
LFTQNAMECMNLQIEDLHAQDETYEHLGTVHTQTFNLIPRYQALVSAQRVIVQPEEADIITTYKFQSPLATVWDWIIDIQKRNQAMGEMGHWKIISRTKGRTGIGSSNHCAHGRGASIEIILDWRPFEYTTIESVDGNLSFRETIIFTSLNNNTNSQVEVRVKLLKPKPLFIMRPIMKGRFNKENPYIVWFSEIAKLLAQETQP